MRQRDFILEVGDDIIQSYFEQLIVEVSLISFVREIIAQSYGATDLLRIFNLYVSLQ